MTRFRYGILAALLLLCGCGGGETVPLVSPTGHCDYAPDPRWQLDTGFLGDDYVRGVGWPEGGRPVVVGRNGFIAENEEPGQWHRESSGVQGDLDFVLGDGAGGLLALGPAAATVRLADGRWQPVAGLPEVSWWYRPVFGAGAYWLPGSSGTLARIGPDASLSLVPLPTEENVRAVLAEPDSLFVAGQDGFCQVRVGGTWSTLDVPFSAEGYVQNLFRLDDGRLLAVVNGDDYRVHVREADGWVAHPEINQDSNVFGFSYEDGYLWVRGWEWLRWDVRGDTWTYKVYPAANSSQAGFGPDGALFQGYSRSMLWYAEGPGGEIVRTVDTAIAPSFSRLFRLLDGTVVGTSRAGFYIIEATGPRHVLSHEMVLQNPYVAGASLQDFYFLSDGLYHFVQGQEPQAIPLPEDMNSWSGIVVNQTGQIMIHYYERFCVWDGAEWQVLGGGFQYYGQPMVTRQQTMVMMTGNYAFYLGPNGLVEFALPFVALGVSEMEPGLLMFHSRYLERCLYQMGTGIIQELPGTPPLDCDGVRSQYFVETEDGGLFVTREANLVIRITVSGTRAEWELVAGPWTDEIEELQVLADGSLAALDDATGRLLIYPAPGN